jgi:TatD DNase family protein
MIIDSHCHLDYSSLYNQLDDVIDRALKNKIDYLLTICTTLESFKKINLITKKFKNVFGTFGIHPHETKKFTNVNKDFILNSVNSQKKIIGIGESGLDFYYNFSDKSIQEKSFIDHINAAAELNIPIIVHSRNAETETYEILKNEMKNNNNLKVLIHCFTGSNFFAKKLIDLNCYISVSGIITFKNSAELVKTVSNIPLDNLLVETDSPYLSPVPFRGKPNEPSYLKYTVEKLADIKNIPSKDIMKSTSNNFLKIFSIK